jgi:hypothetical protein
MPSPDDVRRLALALPEAYEDTHRRKPAFRVNKRIFAMLGIENPAAKLAELDAHLDEVRARRAIIVALIDEVREIRASA